MKKIQLNLVQTALISMKEQIETITSRKKSGVNSIGLWDLYNLQKIVDNQAVLVNNFTSYLLNTVNS